MVVSLILSPICVGELLDMSENRMGHVPHASDRDTYVISAGTRPVVMDTAAVETWCIYGDKYGKHFRAWLGDQQVIMRKTRSCTERISVNQEDFTSGSGVSTFLLEYKA